MKNPFKRVINLFKRKKSVAKTAEADNKPVSTPSIPNTTIGQGTASVQPPKIELTYATANTPKPAPPMDPRVEEISNQVNKFLEKNDLQTIKNEIAELEQDQKIFKKAKQPSFFSSIFACFSCCGNDNGKRRVVEERQPLLSRRPAA